MEIISFMEKCGGPYQVIDPETCVNLIECLETDQYVLIRNEAGEITTFCDYWRVNMADMGLLKSGGKPTDTSSGNAIFVVDCCNLDDKSGITMMMREVRRRHPNSRGVAWFRERKLPECFRFFPSQRGGYG